MGGQNIFSNGKRELSIVGKKKSAWRMSTNNKIKHASVVKKRKIRKSLSHINISNDNEVVIIDNEELYTKQQNKSAISKEEDDNNVVVVEGDDVIERLATEYKSNDLLQGLKSKKELPKQTSSLRFSGTKTIGKVILEYPFVCRQEDLVKSAIGFHEAYECVTNKLSTGNPGREEGQYKSDNKYVVTHINENNKVVRHIESPTCKKLRAPSYNSTVKDVDVERLVHSDWLNDEVINFWIQW